MNEGAAREPEWIELVLSGVTLGDDGFGALQPYLDILKLSFPASQIGLGPGEVVAE